MTLPRYSRLIEHWRGFPPVRMLVAGAVGFKPRPRKKTETEPRADFAAFAALTGGKPGTITMDMLRGL